MRSLQIRLTALGSATWTVGFRVIVLVTIISAFAVLLFVFWQRAPRDTKSGVTPGNIRDTRIVADHALQTKWGSQLTWKAEYKVVYLVGGNEYAVWADSGIRGDDEDGVRFALPKSHPSCRVQYNPQKPEASVALCRDEN
jgi:hypothetical protein